MLEPIDYIYSIYIFGYKFDIFMLDIIFLGYFWIFYLDFWI